MQKVTRCKLQSFHIIVAEVTFCRSCSVQKITRYSLKHLLVTRCKKSLVPNSKESCSQQRSLASRYGIY